MAKHGEVNEHRLFESCKIAGMRLSNRFVRSATWEGMAKEDVAVTPKLIEVICELARGGVGLIMSGHIWPMPAWTQSR